MHLTFDYASIDTHAVKVRLLFIPHPPHHHGITPTECIQALCLLLRFGRTIDRQSFGFLIKSMAISCIIEYRLSCWGGRFQSLHSISILCECEYTGVER